MFHDAATGTERQTDRPLFFPWIDVLRAAAAAMVLAYHVIESGRWADFPTSGFVAYLRIGWVGVDLFFVISGFVIALSALQMHARLGAGMHLPFAVRRFARIAPLYLLTGVLYLIVIRPGFLQGSLNSIAGHLLSHLLFVHNLHRETAGSINAPTWTIGIEVQFYVAVALLTPWLARTSAWRMLGVLVLLALAYRFATTLALPPGVSDTGWQHFYAAQLPGVIDQFAIGMALAVVVFHGVGRGARWLAPGWGRSATWLVLGLLVVWQALTASTSYWDKVEMIVLWRPLLSAGFACLVAAAMCCPKMPVWVKPVQYLGTISYGIYLWHVPVIETSMRLFPDFNGGWWMAYVASVTLVLAAASWHLFEKPAMRRISAWRGRPVRVTPTI